MVHKPTRSRTLVRTLSSETFEVGSRLNLKVPGKTRASWGKQIKRSRTVFRSTLAMSTPSIVIEPSFGSIKRRKVESRVLLPLGIFVSGRKQKKLLRILLLTFLSYRKCQTSDLFQLRTKRSLRQLCRLYDIRQFHLANSKEDKSTNPYVTF